MLNTTVEEAKNEILDWSAFANTQNNVTDMALSLLNSARQFLWQKHNWDYLVSDYSLSATTDSQSLPSDYGKIIEVFYDSNSDNQPDFFFYRNCKDISRAYKMRSTYDINTGHAFTIQFMKVPNNAPTLRYQKALADFTSGNESTEYLFFPKELLLYQAQIIGITRHGVIDKEFEVIKREYNEALEDYKQAHQYRNNMQKRVVNDQYGNEINIENYSMLGDGGGGMYDDYDNSRLRRY